MNIGEFIHITKGITKSPKSTPIKNIIYGNFKFVKNGDFFWVKDKAGYQRHIEIALNKGAKGIIAPKSHRGTIREKSNISYIYVDKSMIFKYSQYHRNQLSLPVIGITGSAGKTTTKNMLTQILRTQGKVTSTIASINAVGSAPFYAMRMKKSDKFGVFEMGMKGLGQIRTMSAYLQPTIGIITNIGDAHIGKLGNSIQNIVKAKQEIIPKIKSNGYLILNADNAYTKNLDLSKFKGRKIVYFGIHNSADVKGYDIQYNRTSTSFKVSINNQTYQFNVKAIGEHNVYNALASIAAASILNVPIEKIRSQLASFRNAGMRSQVLRGINNSTIISDAYNANPTAAIEGMKAMKEIANGKNMLAVIGNISEQGQNTINGHRKVGKTAADMGIDVIGVGSLGKHVIEGVKQSSNRVSYIHIPAKKDAYEHLKKVLNSETIAYFKASREFKMETLIRRVVTQKKES